MFNPEALFLIIIDYRMFYFRFIYVLVTPIKLFLTYQKTMGFLYKKYGICKRQILLQQVFSNNKL